MKSSVTLLAFVHVAVMLDPSNPQARHSAALYSPLPTGELFQAQRIELAGLVDGKQAARHRSDDFGLAANDPAIGAGRRQGLERQGLAERADDLCGTNFLVLEHSVR